MYCSKFEFQVLFKIGELIKRGIIIVEDEEEESEFEEEIKEKELIEEDFKIGIVNDKQGEMDVNPSKLCENCDNNKIQMQ